MAATSRDVLLEKARDLVLEQGLSATSIDQICEAAGVTKGCFFHHFESKEALGVALFERWALHPVIEDLPGYVNELIAKAKAGKLSKGCLIATMSQEESMRGACGRRFDSWMRALREAGATADTAAHFVAVLEGAIILDRAGQNAAAVKALEKLKTVI